MVGTRYRGRVVLRRALRLSAEGADVLVMAQEWYERESRLDMFVIPAGAIDRMGTVRAIADLGLPVFRETNLLLDRTADNLNWVTSTLIAPTGPFRYVSAVPAISFLTAFVAACTGVGVPLDSIVVRVHADAAFVDVKLAKAFARQMSELGLTQVRTDTAMLERFAEQFSPFDIWLDDHSEAEHHRTLDTTTSAAVVILDSTSPHWSH
jgi:hypothetical protein